MAKFFVQLIAFISPVYHCKGAICWHLSHSLQTNTSISIEEHLQRYNGSHMTNLLV